MTENKTEKSRWSFPLRTLAVVLVAALFCSLIMPSVIALRNAKDKEAVQTQNTTESYELLADLAISEEK